MLLPNPLHLVSWQLCGLLLALSIVVVYGSIVGLRPTERRLFMGSLVLDRRDFSVLSLGWKSPARQKMRHKMTSHGGDVSQSRRTQGGKYADKVTVVRPSSNELEKKLLQLQKTIYSVKPIMEMC